MGAGMRVWTGMILLILMTACSSVTSDWSTAQRDNSIAGYQAFLWKHVNGRQADEAWTRLGSLLDDQDWQTAQSASTIEGYGHYLQMHPKGKYTTAAEAKLSSIAPAAGNNLRF